jgi:hypothetical protein
VVAQVEQTGLDAVPIVSLLTFMVGAVVAFLGATVLADFGASLYTVDLVAFSFLREFAVLLTAILMAGRTASSFTAQIGSMKANEEIDAIRALGLDPINLLVLPRIIALLVSMPMLTFIAMMSASRRRHGVRPVAGHQPDHVPVAAAAGRGHPPFRGGHGQGAAVCLPDRRHRLPEGFKVSGSASRWASTPPPAWCSRSSW